MKSIKIENEPNKLFEQYLKERNLNYESSDKIKIFQAKKQPDFFVHARYGDIICEIKSFETDAIHKDPYVPIRRKIDEARKQFKEYKIKNIPCVLILTKDSNSPVSLGDIWVLGAMYGNVNMEFYRDIPVKMKNLCFGRNGKLRQQNATISAIAILGKVIPKSDKILIQKEKEQDYCCKKSTREIANLIYNLVKYPRILRMRVYHNYKAKNPLSKNIFCGIEDEQYEYDSKSDTFILIE